MKKIIYLLIGLLLLTTACSKEKSKESFIKYMEALKSGDAQRINAINEEWGNGVVSIEERDDQKYMLENFKKLEYKVLSVEEKGNVSELKVWVKAPNLVIYSPKIIEKSNEMASEGKKVDDIRKMMNDEFLNILNTNKDLKYDEEEVTVKMINKDSKWIIDQSDPENKVLASMVIGGLNKIQ